ncbi:MAG: DUF3105 domain-containing protein [Acidimicrobiales bacterium]
MPPLKALFLIALAALGPAACGKGGDGAGSAAAVCGTDTTETLDPGSAQHVLPGAPEPRYSTDPPTSGAHQPGAEAAGVVAAPLARPVQVSVLEAGGVLFQHRSLTPADQRRLEALAGPDVVVSPNPGLTSAVVATAWRHRLDCRGVDPAALSTFVAAHRGRGPG